MGINEYIQIGNQIRKLREEKGISQIAMAKLTGIPYSTYSNYENNNREPGLHQIKKIAKALEVDISDLIGEHVAFSFKEGKNGQINSVKETVTDPAESIILNFYRQLNDTGKHEAFKRIGELTLIERYKQDSPEQMPRPLFKYEPPED